MKTISLLGSTGSIGKNVLDVIRSHRNRYRVAALAAGGNIDELERQVLEFEPEVVSVANERLADALAHRLSGGFRPRILHGLQGNISVAVHGKSEMTVSAVVGAVGLIPTLRAIEAGKDIGLANKETLVMAGRLVMEAGKRCGVRILPIDSEHNAIFQAMEAGRRRDVARIILTASGGPFRTLDKSALETVTPEQALAHPNWDMGRKISIDSATLMNKGLEVIEARWLFDMDVDSIEVVVHPQSIVHSLVEFIDGSVVAQLGLPDMRIPIAYALSYPARLDLDLPRLHLSRCGELRFEAPDFDRFPALSLAFDACRRGGVKPAVLNAANEVAVESFLQGEIRYTDIVKVVAAVLEQIPPGDDGDLDEIVAADRRSRRLAADLVANLGPGGAV